MWYWSVQRGLGWDLLVRFTVLTRKQNTMTTEDDVKNAERSALVSLLNALGDKRVVGAFVTMILALCAYIAYWAMQHTGSAQSTSDKAVPTDYCCAVKKAAEGNGAVATNALAKFSWLGCAMSACQPTPQPAPIPTPTAVIDAGPPAPSVLFPVCNPPTLKAPDPKRIEQYRRTLTPRHKLTERGVMLGFEAVTTASVFWQSNDPWCGNQGSVGACEAFTQLDIVTSQPRVVSYPTQSAFNAAALAAYTWITQNDPYPGAWPQQDTGSDSLTGCKWLVKQGYAKSCQVISGVSAVKVALQSGPVIAGMNWLDGMFTPDRCGNLATTGTMQGGHAESIVGHNIVTDDWYLQNHWDNDWGICLGTHCGYHTLTTAQLFGAALDADFVAPIQ